MQSLDWSCGDRFVAAVERRGHAVQPFAIPGALRHLAVTVRIADTWPGPVGRGLSIQAHLVMQRMALRSRANRSGGAVFPVFHVVLVEDAAWAKVANDKSRKRPSDSPRAPTYRSQTKEYMRVRVGLSGTSMRILRMPTAVDSVSAAEVSCSQWKFGQTVPAL